jgi:putative transposase
MIATVPTRAATGNVSFHEALEPFLQQPGLPFADVLDAASVEQAFRERQALFAGDDIFSTPVVLWAFLAQVLRDGKGAACTAAVADIATYMQQSGRPAPCGDTGDYCRARAKLDPTVLRGLVRQTAGQLQRHALPGWLWHGRHVKLVDGFTFTMPDTPANQSAFPQQNTQTRGVGLPIARACAVLSLATAAIHDVAIGPYQGKETGETALLRQILDCLDNGDVVVFDRYYCSYMMLALLVLRGVDVCARLHHLRPDDFRQGRRLGEFDRLVTWIRPQCPAWMSSELYAQIPSTLTLRMIQFDITDSPARAETITVVTTLTDPAAYPAQDIADLYGCRWNAELDIRSIKQTLNLDHVRCKKPEMVERELWVTLLGYNLIRKVIAAAAALHEKQPRQLGFTAACQTVLSSWMLLATGACGDPKRLAASALKRIAANEVANRPGRIEPRVLKRRRHHYPLMQMPRNVLRAALGKT